MVTSTSISADGQTKRPSPLSCDVVIVGGGPAGSTAATILARSGINTIVIERESFPRFHVGESTMPAIGRIFKRLGVLDQVRGTYVRKPGAKWFYGKQEIKFPFTLVDKHACFRQDPSSVVVERATFDEMLLRNAQLNGATVLEQHAVTELLQENDGVNGVRVRTVDNDLVDVKARVVLDCSGQRALVGSALGLKRETSLKRMSLYAHCEADIVDPELKDGWILLQLARDSWLWLFKMGDRKISLGAVVDVDRFREVSVDPESFLRDLVASQPRLRASFSNERVIGKVHTVGNMAYTCQQLAGNGWVLVGDAAYFIDPCYSPGIYLAMLSAEMVADALVPAFANNNVGVDVFTDYQAVMRKHEKKIGNVVDALYRTSNSKTLTWAIPRFTPKLVFRKFNTFLGGDLDKNDHFIDFNLSLLRAAAAVLP